MAPQGLFKMSIASIFQKLVRFLLEVRNESKKVNWPSPQETALNTLIVILFSVVVAALLGFFDFVFTSILAKVIS